MEPSEALDKLKGFVETKKEEKASGVSSWVTGIVIFFVVVIGMFIFAWQSNKNAKELAKLRHEKNKAEIEQANAEAAKKIEENGLKQAELEKKIEESITEISEINKGIKKAEAAREADKQAIGTITSWKEV